jgi:Family of unknown function (DUF6518)
MVLSVDGARTRVSRATRPPADPPSTMEVDPLGNRAGTITACWGRGRRRDCGAGRIAPGRSGPPPWWSPRRRSSGLYADVGQYAPGFWGRLPEAGTPWVVLAFLGGRCARRRACGAPAGAALVLLGLATYVLWVHLAYGTSLYNIANDGRGAWWAFLGLVLGCASGLAGASTRGGREGRRQLAWGYVVGVPLAEAVHVLAARVEPHAAALAVCLLGTAVALAMSASRRVARGGLLMSAAGWAFAGLIGARVLYS